MIEKSLDEQNDHHDRQFNESSSPIDTRLDTTIISLFFHSSAYNLHLHTIVRQTIRNNLIEGVQINNFRELGTELKLD